MNGRRKIAIVMLVLVIGAAGLLLHFCLASNADRARVRARYDQMCKALSAGDTNAMALLFAPAYRARANDHFGRLTTFARPLGPRSGISITGARAEICPVRLHPMIPVGNWGHTIEMIQVEGEWFFTGKISIW